MMSFPLVLDGFPRCGSTTLARILSLHPDIECCMEPFHPIRYGGQYNRIALLSSTVAPALKLMSVRWNALKHVWDPGTAWPFIGQQQLNDDLIRNAETVINLRRQNLLRQIVSGHISRHLRFWVGTSAEFRHRLDSAYLPPISVIDTANGLSAATAALSDRTRLLKTFSSKQLTFRYEEFFSRSPSDQLTYINNVFEQLGLHRMDLTELHAKAAEFLDSSAYKWAAEDVYDRVPGIRVIDKELGNDYTGRIFE